MRPINTTDLANEQRSYENINAESDTYRVSGDNVSVLLQFRKRMLEVLHRFTLPLIATTHACGT